MTHVMDLSSFFEMCLWQLSIIVYAKNDPQHSTGLRIVNSSIFMFGKYHDNNNGENCYFK